MITEIEMTGIREAEVALTRFGPELAGNILLPALAEAARTIRAAILARAKATFKAQSGWLFRNIVAQPEVESFRGGGRGVVIRWFIGVRKHPSKPPYPFFWERGFQHIGRSKSLSRRIRRSRRLVRQIAREDPDAFTGADIARTAGLGTFMQREFIGPAFLGVYQQVVQRLAARIGAGIDETAQQLFRRAA